MFSHNQPIVHWKQFVALHFFESVIVPLPMAAKCKGAYQEEPLDGGNARKQATRELFNPPSLPVDSLPPLPPLSITYLLGNKVDLAAPFTLKQLTP